MLANIIQLTNLDLKKQITINMIIDNWNEVDNEFVFLANAVADAHLVTLDDVQQILECAVLETEIFQFEVIGIMWIDFKHVLDNDAFLDRNLLDQTLNCGEHIEVVFSVNKCASDEG